MRVPRRRLPHPPWNGGALVGVAALILLSCVGHHTSGQSPTESESTPIALHAKQFAARPSETTPGIPSRLNGVKGLVVSSSDIPTGHDLTNWVAELTRRGITMLLVEIGTGEPTVQVAGGGHPRPHGVYFHSGWAPTVRDVFGEVIPVARQHGVTVFAMVSLRDMNWVDPTLGWMDRFYDVRHREVRLSPYLDLFHPGFQEYLIGLLTDLADTGIDGMLFRNAPALGPYDGLSAFALGGFQREFNRALDPAELFLAATPREGERPKFRPEFWQWAGWKARERMNVLERLGRAMRLRNPRLHVALEMHREAVMKPAAALVRYAEDLLEAKRRFEFFLIAPDSPNVPREVAGDGDSPWASTISSMVAQLENPERVWLGTPVALDHGIRPGRLPSSSDRQGLDTSIGLILMGTGPAVP